MAKIFLHIGTGKTGTTSIQKALFENRKKLADSDILYPATGLFKGAHHYLAGAWKGVGVSSNESKEVLWSNLLQEIENFSQVIISSEQFSGSIIAPSMASEVADFLRGHEVTIIIYLRPHDEFIESVWNEWIKAPPYRTESLEEFVSLFDNQLSFMSNYLGIIKAWSEAFSRDNILVRPFQKDQFIGSNLITDFCHHVEIDIELPFRKNLNSSIGNYTLQVMRLANKLEIPIEQRCCAYKKLLALTQDLDSLFQGKNMPVNTRKELLEKNREMYDEISNIFLEGTPLFNIDINGFNDIAKRVEISSQDILKLLLQSLGTDS